MKPTPKRITCLHELTTGALAPNLWHLEVGNMLLQAEKQGRITAPRINLRLALLADLPITTDTETAPRAFQEILTLAASQRLTTYDAACLERAIRRGIALATKDKALIRAAHATKVQAMPARISDEWRALNRKGMVAAVLIVHARRLAGLNELTAALSAASWRESER